jgi:hypothetical protein
MKLSHHRIGLLLLVAGACVALSGCGVVNRIRAKNALNEGARAYKDGRFDEAEQSFRYAHELDPEQKNAPLFIARAVHQQYKPGVDTPENKEKADRAVEAYKQVLAAPGIDEKHREDAYSAIAYIYRQMREEAKEEEWLAQRAASGDAPPAKRSDAYTILASKQWDCAYNITEQKENKKTVDRGANGIIVEYVKPKNPDDFNKAMGCVERGLDLVNKAVEQNKENPNAWSYKTNLLRERAKLAQMDGKAEDKTRFESEANAAEQEQKRLNAAANQRKADEDAKKTPPAAS